MIRDHPPLRIGISSCLIGEKVRYDGGHKMQPVVSTLAPFVEWLPICPEVDIGLGVPRPPIHIEESETGKRLVMPSTGQDLTIKMREYAKARASQDDFAELRGYVLKSRSPSCALNSAPYLTEDSPTPKETRGPGFFSEEIQRRYPDLPMAEETALSSPAALSAFVERVCAYDRLMNFFSRERSLGQMVMLKSQSRVQMQTHGEDATRELDALLEASAGVDPEYVIPDYFAMYMRALRPPPTLEAHAHAIEGLIEDFEELASDDHLAGMRSGLAEFRSDGTLLAQLRRTLASVADELEHPRHIHSTYLEPYRIEVELAAAV